MLSARDLNRATLARQMLLERAPVDVVEGVRRLAGVQAQEPRPPYLGLWARLEGFARDDLHGALRDGRVLRATAMRGTLHALAAEDFATWRPALQPVLETALAAIKDRSEGLDREATLAAARELLAERPRTFGETRAALSERFGGVDERALGFLTRMCLPLVMVPSEDRWSFARDSPFALADDRVGEADLAALVRGYLGAFGPATVRDAETWSGLKGLAGTFAALRDELVTFADERGRELFDLPGAPRPGPDVAAPPRLLPEFDNLVLAHADRTRVIDDEHRPLLTKTGNLRIRPTYLVDGRVAGAWALAAKKRRATVTLEPFAKAPPKRVLAALAREAESLARFVDPDVPVVHVVVSRA